MVGKLLRHYRIEEQIGQGGMGVVYRATDTHLDRPVAIKALPHHLVASPDRKKRFIQEAKAASALNHPNIVTIYDIDEGELDGADVHFMAMEFVPGETLDKPIARGRVKVKDALEWAIQLAGALAAAHAAGIVHRDIKPSNIIVTGQGGIKLLDFGLAKLSEPSQVDFGAETEMLAASSLSQPTEEGMIVGTVAYMSPEQAEGKRVDGRSDIFSLGSVMYELFGGSKPFESGSKIGTLTAILHKDPVPLSTLQPDFRDDLERIVFRCLRREPERRWQHVSDLRLALEDVRDELTAGRTARPAAAAAAAAAPPATAWPRRRAVLSLLGAGAAGAAGGFYSGRALFRSEPVSYTRLTFQRGDVNAARFAPDGSVIYSANWEGTPYSMYSMRPGIRESRPLGLGASSRLLGVASTSELAIHLAKNDTLARVPLSGGAPRELLENVLEADWAPDAKELAVVRRVEGGKFRLEYPVGRVLHETAGSPPMRPRISPDGDSVAFFEIDRSLGGVGDVRLALAGAGSPPRALLSGMRGVAGLAWTPSGRELWISAIRKASDNPSVFAVGVSGEVRLLTQSANWLSIHDISPAGEMLAASTSSRVGMRGRLPGESEARDISWHENSAVSQMTADGSLLFFELGAGEGRNNAILHRRPGQDPVRLGDGNYPALSPDGKWVACIRRDEAQTVLLAMPAGAGETRVFPRAGFRYQQPLEWLPDGKRILFNASREDGPVRAYTIPFEGGEAAPVTEPGVRGLRVSPDGKWLVAGDAKSTWLQPAIGGARVPVAGLRADDSVIGWSRASDALFVRRPDGPRLRVERLSLAGGTRTLLHDLAAPEPGDTFRREFAVADEGRAYAYSFQRDLASLFLVRGLK